MKKLISTITVLITIIVTAFLCLQKAKADLGCFSTIQCYTMNGQQPIALCQSTNGVNRDVLGYWDQGWTTNQLVYQEGDIVYIQYDQTNACDGASHKVASVKCINPNTMKNMTVDLWMSSCMWHAQWVLHGSCNSTSCTVDATLIYASQGGCHHEGPCAD